MKDTKTFIVFLLLCRSEIFNQVPYGFKKNGMIDLGTYFS